MYLILYIFYVQQINTYIHTYYRNIFQIPPIFSSSSSSSPLSWRGKKKKNPPPGLVKKCHHILLHNVSIELIQTTLRNI